MKLTEQQVNFFNTFGYLAFHGLFAPDEIAWITEEFDDSIQNFGGGKEHDGSKARCLGAPLSIVPDFALCWTTCVFWVSLAGFWARISIMQAGMETIIAAIPAGIPMAVGGNSFLAKLRFT